MLRFSIFQKTFTQPETPLPSQSFGPGMISASSAGSGCLERKNGRIPMSTTTTQLTSCDRHMSNSRGSLPSCNDVKAGKSLTPSGAIILV
jgi:hypothetical protein